MRNVNEGKDNVDSKLAQAPTVYDLILDKVHLHVFLSSSALRCGGGVPTSWHILLGVGSCMLCWFHTSLGRKQSIFNEKCSVFV